MVARFDPRVRSVAQLELATGFPVLASVPFYPTPRDRRRSQAQNMMLGMIVVGVGMVYLLVIWLRLKG
jgi:hypothetical protein